MDSEDYQLRYTALDFALRIHHVGDNCFSIVGTAEAFLKFLRPSPDRQVPIRREVKAHAFRDPDEEIPF